MGRSCRSSRATTSPHRCAPFFASWASSFSAPCASSASGFTRERHPLGCTRAPHTHARVTHARTHTRTRTHTHTRTHDTHAPPHTHHARARLARVEGGRAYGSGGASVVVVVGGGGCASAVVEVVLVLMGWGGASVVVVVWGVGGVKPKFTLALPTTHWRGDIGGSNRGVKSGGQTGGNLVALRGAGPATARYQGA